MMTAINTGLGDAAILTQDRGFASRSQRGSCMTKGVTFSPGKRLSRPCGTTVFSAFCPAKNHYWQEAFLGGCKQRAK